MKKLSDKSKFNKRTIWLPVLTFILLLVILFAGIHKFEGILREQNLKLTEQSIQKAIVQCYANEGFYPASLSYLEDNYYLSIDYDDYHVYYECIASNLIPDVEVFER